MDTKMPMGPSAGISTAIQAPDASRRSRASAFPDIRHSEAERATAWLAPAGAARRGAGDGGHGARRGARRERDGDAQEGSHGLILSWAAPRSPRRRPVQVSVRIGGDGLAQAELAQVGRDLRARADDDRDQA